MKLRPSAAGAAFAHDLDAKIAEVFARFSHFSDALHLPGDLVDVIFGTKVFGISAGILPLVEFFLVEQGKGMMIPRMPAKISSPCRLGDKETEQVEIKMPARFEYFGVEAEMAEAANLEGPVEGDAADIIFFCVRIDHDWSPSGAIPLSLPDGNLFQV